MNLQTTFTAQQSVYLRKLYIFYTHYEFLQKMFFLH